MAIAEYAVLGAAAYLLGSIPTGVFAARMFAGADVHRIGSGHTGMLNTFRAAGVPAAVATLIGDGLKGLIAVLLAHLWLGDGWDVVLAAGFAVLGHCYPVFAGFRGGMGLATSGGEFLYLQPLVLIGLIVAWFPLRWLLRDSTYASLAIAVLLPLLLFFLGVDTWLLDTGLVVGIILFARHLRVLIQNKHG